MSKYGKIHVVYGDDRKGSCALVGGAVRACGAGLDVGFIWFGSTDGSYAAVLEGIEGIDYVRCESREISGRSYRNGESGRCAEAALDYASAGSDGGLDVLILDGFLDSVDGADEIIALMDYATDKEIELMMCGSRCKDEIIERADYVSEIKNTKLPHASWIYGREGDICEICGDGKGKTTMLVGDAVSYAGDGKKVDFIQFMKDGTSSEVGILKNIQGVKYLCPGHHDFIDSGNSPTDEQREHAKLALGYVYSSLDGGADVVICDEILTANGSMSVSTEEIRKLIKYAKGKRVKLMMSGHSCKRERPWVVDCIYEVNKIKHPYYDGLRARYGIEY